MPSKRPTAISVLLQILDELRGLRSDVRAVRLTVRETTAGSDDKVPFLPSPRIRRVIPPTTPPPDELTAAKAAAAVANMGLEPISVDRRRS